MPLFKNKSNSFICTCFFLFLFTVSVCARKQIPTFEALPDKAKVVVIRKQFKGFSIFMSLYLNNELVGRHKGNSYFTLDLEPGMHEFVTIYEYPVGPDVTKISKVAKNETITEELDTLCSEFMVGHGELSIGLNKGKVYYLLQYSSSEPLMKGIVNLTFSNHGVGYELLSEEQAGKLLRKIDRVDSNGEKYE